MSLETEKRQFADLLNRIPEITMNSPSFSLELSEHISDLPFFSSSQTDHNHECFCQNNDDDSILLTCACCGERSHASCYHISERPVSNDSFYCIYCQQKALDRISEQLFENISHIEEKTQIISQKFDELQKENNMQIPDAFGCIQNAASSQELSGRLHELLVTSQAVWKDICKDLEEINLIAENDLFEPNE